jgi:selenide,water dikinase
VLQPLKDTFIPEQFPDLLVGLAAADDAAVYRLNDDQAIVSSTDFFPPVVDDPYDFGSIAAANALSDIYAMGGKPIFAINLVAFPEGMDLDHLREILRGGAEKVAEAGAVIAGGHSISDKEPKYGLAATGIVDPDALMTKGGSRPGDVLLLTKKIGTGILTTALKRQLATSTEISEAITSMKQLNRDAAKAAAAGSATSVTDVTGFGLLGHAHEMAHLGKVNFKLYIDKLRWLPGAKEYGRRETFPGGMGNNKFYFERWVNFDGEVPASTRDMLWTPETSGGLLFAVSPDAVQRAQSYYSDCYVIGEVEAGDGHINVFAHSDQL